MDLKSPWTLTVSWLLVPLLVTLAMAGLGAGVSVASRLPLGVLTLPSGYLAGIAIITFALEVGIGGVAAVSRLLRSVLMPGSERAKASMDEMRW